VEATLRRKLMVGQKNLALIPARGGSKGLPGKNTKLLGGLPLIAHTLQAARESQCFDRLVVSTDSPSIAEVAIHHGADVPFLRPAALATDKASVVDVALHAIEFLSKEYVADTLMLLQPTSPFRSAATIKTAFELFAQTGRSVISVNRTRDHPYWCMRIEADGSLQRWLGNVEIPLTRQDLPPTYTLNGAIYLASIATLKVKGSFYSDPSQALVMEEREAIDIDTPLDWSIAECLFTLRVQEKEV